MVELPISADQLPLGGGFIVDANVLVKAGVFWIARQHWPETPPDLTPVEACVMGVAADADEWVFWLSPKLKSLTADVLMGKLGAEFRWKPLGQASVDAYLAELDQLVSDCGGGCIKPRGRVQAVGDDEDDKNVVSLAVSIPARVVVTADRLVLSRRVRTLPTSEGDESFWFISPQEFVETTASRRS